METEAMHEMIGAYMIFVVGVGIGFVLGWWAKVWQLTRKEFRDDF